MVYRIGPAGEILFINHFVEELIGYSPSEYFASPACGTRRFMMKIEKGYQDFGRRLRKKEEEFIVEYRIMHKKGYIVYVVDHAIPVLSSDVLVGSVDGIIMDVTGRVKMQGHFIQSEGIRTISEVSARLAHEIRNPLVSAGGFARRLLSSMSNSDPNRRKWRLLQGSRSP